MGDFHSTLPPPLLSIGNRLNNWHFIQLRCTVDCTIAHYCPLATDFTIAHIIQGVFLTGTPPKKSTKKLIYARLGVSRPIYVAVDSPNLGFPYINFLGGYQ